MDRPVWVRKLIKRLYNVDIISNISIRNDCLIVYYKTGFRHSLIYNNIRKRRLYEVYINKHNSSIDKLIPHGMEFPWKPFATDEEKREAEKYFKISRSTLDNASELQRQILMQELLYRLRDSGYYTYQYSLDDLDNTINTLQSLKNSYSDGVFITNPTYPNKLWRPGFDIAQRYFDIGNVPRDMAWSKKTTINDAFNINEILYNSISYIVHRTKLDLTLGTVIRNIATRRGPRWVSPVTYKAIISQLFKPTPSTIISDPNPYIGVKAIASRLLNIQYNVVGSHKYYDDAVNNGFTSDMMINTTHQDPPYDILMADNNFQPLELETAKKYRAISRRMLLYVPKDDLNTFRSEFKPSRIIRVKRTTSFQPDFMFICD